MSFILSLLNSRLGVAGIGFVLLLCGFGWHKIQTGYLQHKVTVLETEKLDVENLRKACELNLSGVRTVLVKHNREAEASRVEADRRVAEAGELAAAKLTSPEEIERVVARPGGPEKMNLFVVGLYGRNG